MHLHSFVHDDPTQPADYFAELVARVVERHQVERVQPHPDREVGAPVGALDCGPAAAFCLVGPVDMDARPGAGSP